MSRGEAFELMKAIIWNIVYIRCFFECNTVFGQYYCDN